VEPRDDERGRHLRWRHRAAGWGVADLAPTRAREHGLPGHDLRQVELDEVVAVGADQPVREAAEPVAGEAGDELGANGTTGPGGFATANRVSNPVKVLMW
jgi:hypothetical protein